MKGTARWGWIVGTVVLAAWVAGFGWFLVTSIHSSYSHLGLLDTQVYRMGGRAILDHADLYRAAYNWDGLQFTYPPFAAVVFVPLARAGFSGGALVMTAASAVALARSLILVVRGVTRVSGARATAGATVVLGAVGVATAVAVWPMRSTFEYGQINVVVMWLVLEDLLGPAARRRWSGVLLGVAIGLKLTPAVFLVLLVATGQRRRAVVAATTFAATVLVGVAVQPSSAWTYWTSALFDSSRVGRPLDPSNQSLAGMIGRLAGRPVPVVWLVVAAAVLAAVTVLARRLWAAGNEPAAVVTMAIGGLLCSPISWAHHWVWLVPAVVVVVGQALGPPPRRAALVAVALAVVVASVRIETIVSAGGADWEAPTALDWLAGNVYVLLAAGFLVVQWRWLTRWRLVTGDGSLTSPVPLPELRQS